MEEYLQKRMYVYRKSFNYYNSISMTLSITKCIFSLSSLSAFVLIPLSALSLGVGIAEVLEKTLSVSDKKSEYKQTYKFYKHLLNSFKSNSVSEEEIFAKEKDYIQNLKYFPLEKYIKKAKLNGYKYIEAS